MRLSEFYVTSIIDTIDHYMANNEGELRLYGSRANPKAKGGDIDLLLLLKTNKMLEELISNKFIILEKIMQKIGDQKIDLTINSYEEVSQEPFLKLIYPKSVLLKQW